MNHFQVRNKTNRKNRIILFFSIYFKVISRRLNTKSGIRSNNLKDLNSARRNLLQQNKNLFRNMLNLNQRHLFLYVVHLESVTNVEALRHPALKIYHQYADNACIKNGKNFADFNDIQFRKLKNKKGFTSKI